FQRGAQGKTGLEQMLDIGEETESAGAGQFAAEGAWLQIEDLALAPDHVALEIDLDIEPEAAVSRPELGEAAALFDAHGFQDFHETAGRGQLAQADAIDRLD